QDLYRKVRSILNKLTPQKFDTLIQQVHDLSIDTEEKLKGCIKLIFEKAIGEPSYSIAYAQMAKSLNNLRVHMDEQPSETVTFRKLLLNQCQKEFEKDKLEEIDLEKMTLQIEQSTSEKEKLQLTEAKQQAENVAKRRSIGNIRFIGELYKLKMLTDNIMFECINRLLKYSNDEDNVECLCRLLITIGFDLDNANPLSKQRLNQTFEELKSISYSKSISSRIKFMIQDVLELRENDWVPRREDTQPKLIEQIHKEA
ncbi:hypothetical protein HELRODRAFT_134242, partial [Helobdella robusta]|uniref:MIF4G domain-containing protein n=1 Tax=Helobdella robusta TaxID=6412 RepID=T1EI36_HELRO